MDCHLLWLFFLQLVEAQMFVPPNIFADDVCFCVPTGRCINNRTSLHRDTTTRRPSVEAADGRLHTRLSRIVKSSSNSTDFGIFNPFVMPVFTGVKIEVSNMTSCEKGLELCCPSTGYGCGVRHPPIRDAPRTNSSDNSPYGAYPWQVAILSNQNDYIGAGVLIDHRHVLTAAHKVYRSSNIKCRFGEWDFDNKYDLFPIVDIDVDDNDIVLHPNFTDLRTLRNNIAILRLNYPGVELGAYPTITHACIPNEPLSDQRCWVSGWGKNSFASTDPTPVMKHVDLPLVNHSACQENLRTTRLGSSFILSNESFICAGGELGKDACTNDGGSGLVCLVNGRFYLIGLVAWGIGCGKKNIPGVYVNVLSYLPWIQKTIRELEEKDPGNFFRRSTSTTAREASATAEDEGEPSTQRLLKSLMMKA